MTERFEKLCLVGAGLMGASAAVALKKRVPAIYIEVIDLRLNGQDGERLQNKYRELIDRGWIDDITHDPQQGLKNADVLLLALPLGMYSEYFASFTPPPGLLVTDAGSAKQCVIDKASESWNGSLKTLVPAHPVAGAAQSGYEHADADLYEGANVILTPHIDSADWAIARAESFWRALGVGHIEYLAADAHDALLGFTSHLPQLIAYALARTAHKMHSHSGFAAACGPGLRDSTRLAASDPAMWRDVCDYNSTNLKDSTSEFIGQFERMRQLILNGDFETLKQEFSMAMEDGRALAALTIQGLAKTRADDEVKK